MERMIYLKIKDNLTDVDEGGLYWPDVMTFPINKFKYTQTPEVYVIDQFYIDRFDMLMFDYYGVSYYDDMVLWLNNIEYKQDLVSGQKLLMPTSEDLERFYITYIV